MLENINPATGEIIERLQVDDRRTVHGAFRLLKKSQRAWGQTSLRERASILRRFSELLGDRQQEMARLLTREVGKPIRQARVELLEARWQVESFIGLALEDFEEEVWSRQEGTSQVLAREPLGVIAHISSWTSPYLTGVQAVVPALLMGNAVMYKPSEQAPSVGLATGDLLLEAGVPGDVLRVIVGDGQVGDFVLDERISAVFFSGTPATGRMVVEKLATKMIPRHLEMSGKDGVYICDDVDVEKVARQVGSGAFYNCGQNASSVERIYVHERIYRHFLEALCEVVHSYEMGNPAEESTFIGPVAHKEQILALEYQVADALQKGARLLCGGRAGRGRGFYFDPTLLADADHRMLVMREKTPGPVVAVQCVESDEMARDRLDDSHFGLTAAVFSGDEDRALAILRSLEVGTAYWNGCTKFGALRPGSGLRHSGSKQNNGYDPIVNFARQKTWHLHKP